MTTPPVLPPASSPSDDVSISLFPSFRTNDNLIESKCEMIPTKIRIYCMAGFALTAAFALINQQMLTGGNRLSSFGEAANDDGKLVSVFTAESNSSLRASWGAPNYALSQQLAKQVDPDAMPLRKFKNLELDLFDSLKNRNVTRKGDVAYPVLQSGNIPKDPVKRIALIGERNSGTSWMFSELNKCFNHTLKVRQQLFGCWSQSRGSNLLRQCNITQLYLFNSTSKLL
jgi:hypothetical protein